MKGPCSTERALVLTSRELGSHFRVIQVRDRGNSEWIVRCDPFLDIFGKLKQ